MNFLSNILREEGGFEYKKAIVDSILILIRDIPEAKESGLSHLCEFIEDCEFTYLSTQVGLTIAAWIYELDAEAPFKTLDILDMYAVAKHSALVCADAHDLIETRKLQLAEVSCPMHQEVANCCRYFSFLLAFTDHIGNGLVISNVYCDMV